MSAFPSSAPLAAIHPPDSLRGLLIGVLDYAGLFPPARLPLDEAITNYGRYRAGDAAWMLGDFVVPAPRLVKLDSSAPLFADHPPFTFSVLMGGGPDADTCLATLADDIAAADRFTKAHMGGVRVAAVEMKLPVALFGASQSAVRTFLQRVTETFAGHGVEVDRVFIEVPVDEAEARAALLAAIPLADTGGFFAWAAKLRLGGVNPGDHPPVAPVATAIAAMHRAGVAFKATAGLHHPVRHVNVGVGEPMHGFLNVFGGAALLHAGAIAPERLAGVLAEEDATQFTATDTHFAWRDAAIGPGALRNARDAFALSFGSCSLAEPLADLAALGY